MKIKVDLKDLVTDADIKAELRKLNSRTARLERELAEARDKNKDLRYELSEARRDLEEAQQLPKALKDLLRRCGINVGREAE